jgi:hypothetical protein
LIVVNDSPGKKADYKNIEKVCDSADFL